MAVTLTPAVLVALVTDLASKPPGFYLLAQRLHELHAASPADFKKVITSGVVGKRRGYQLIRIARVFVPSKISTLHLEAAGFTKLGLIAEKHENAEKAYVLDADEIEDF